MGDWVGERDIIKSKDVGEISQETRYPCSGSVDYIPVQSLTLTAPTSIAM